MGRFMQVLDSMQPSVGLKMTRGRSVLMLGGKKVATKHLCLVGLPDACVGMA